jgi:hypothetical protein
MKRAAAITAIQSVAVILGCALVGLSLTRVPGGDPGDGLFMAVGGAILGAIGAVAGILARGPTREWEQSRSPRQLIGLRIATVGGIVAMVGWLVVVFLSSVVGRWIALVGIVSGGAGLIIHKLTRAK